MNRKKGGVLICVEQDGQITYQWRERLPAPPPKTLRQRIDNIATAIIFFIILIGVIALTAGKVLSR